MGSALDCLRYALLLIMRALSRAGQDRSLSLGNRARRADMHPHAFEPQPVQPTGSRGTVEQRGQRKRAIWRVLEQFRPQQGRARIDEGRELALGPAPPA